MDEGKCASLVRQLLINRDWQLASAHELAGEICADIIRQGLTGTAASHAIQRQLQLLYAAILHDHCLRAESPNHDRVWTELRAWLLRQARHTSYQPEKHEDLVQEAVIELQQRLQQAPLRTPRAFLAFALRVLQRKAIDLARSEQAQARGGRATTLALEALTAADIPQAIGEVQGTSDHRATEASAFGRLDEQQLIAFFEQHLPTDLQQQIAIATFVNGLEPRLIAARLGKPVHEVRLAKARVVERLRRLYAEGHQQLIDILKVEEPQ